MITKIAKYRLFLFKKICSIIYFYLACKKICFDEYFRLIALGRLY